MSASTPFRPTIVQSSPKPAVTHSTSRPITAAERMVEWKVERTRILEILEAARDAGEPTSALALEMIADQHLHPFTARQRFAAIKAERQAAADIKAAGDYVHAITRNTF